MSSIDIVQMSLDGIEVVALFEDDNVVILEVITRGGQGGEERGGRGQSGDDGEKSDERGED